MSPPKKPKTDKNNSVAKASDAVYPIKEVSKNLDDSVLLVLEGLDSLVVREDVHNGEMPVVGDYLVVPEKGPMRLQRAADMPQPELSPETPLQMVPVVGRYIANPVEVEAYVIASVGLREDQDGLDVALSNGVNVHATAAMVARFMPQAGDYWVVQPDGYIYLNPKDVFERKYSPVMQGA